MQSFPGRQKFVPASNTPRVRSHRSTLNAKWSRRQQVEHAAAMESKQRKIEAAIAECERNNAEICGRSIII